MPIPTFVFTTKNYSAQQKHAVEALDCCEHFHVLSTRVIRKRHSRSDFIEGCRDAIQFAQREKLEYILITTRKHRFTNAYNHESLLKSIHDAQVLSAYVLSGDAIFFGSIMEPSPGLVWTEQLSAGDFFILFEHSYEDFLKEAHISIHGYGAVSFGREAYFMFPFISTQYTLVRETDDSDEISNNTKVTGTKHHQTITQLRKIAQHYSAKKVSAPQEEDFEDVSIPTYVINLKNRPDRLQHIIGQFEGKDEFDVEIFEAIPHQIGAVGLWQSIKRIVKKAQLNNDEVILVCEDDHVFTSQYDKSSLLKNILIAHGLGANFISGGTIKFGKAVSTTENLYWTDYCLATQFIVIYKRFFQLILDEPFSDTDTADVKISEMTTNKLVLFPFISVQQAFGYSDATLCFDNNQNLITELFNATEERLANIRMKATHFAAIKQNKSNPSNTTFA